MNRPTEARAFVRNTADPEQVKKAGSSVKYREDQEDNDLRTLMSESIGRRVAWRLLSEFGIYKTIYDGHGGRMSFNAGKHDECLRVYEGALTILKPLFDHRPELMKSIADTMDNAKTAKTSAAKAFILRAALDEVIALGMAKKPLWDRLGGQPAVTAVVSWPSCR